MHYDKWMVDIENVLLFSACNVSLADNNTVTSFESNKPRLLKWAYEMCAKQFLSGSWCLDWRAEEHVYFIQFCNQLFSGNLQAVSELQCRCASL